MFKCRILFIIINIITKIFCITVIERKYKNKTSLLIIHNENLTQGFGGGIWEEAKAYDFPYAVKMELIVTG